MLRTFFTPARLVMAVFFAQAIGMANLFPRLPDIEARLGVGPAELGVALLGSTVATLIALPFAGPLIERFGTRRTLLVAFVMYLTALVLPGLATDVPTLFAALFMIGLPYPIVDVAMNIQADREERATGRRIMSTCHGWWSLGSVAGGLTAAGFAALQVDTAWHLFIVAVLTLPAALVISAALPARPAAPAVAATGRKRLFSLPSAGILGLCIFLFGSLMIESAARNWSGIFIRDVTGAPSAYAGLTYGAFALFMAGGRLAGDRLVDAFGPVGVARVCFGIVLLGILTIVFAIDPIMVMAGFAACGFGISLAFPLAVTAAAGRGDRPATVNVAALQLVGISSFMVAPVLIGAVAEVAGLRVGLAVLIPTTILSLFLAGELRTRRKVAAPEPVVVPGETV